MRTTAGLGLRQGLMAAGAAAAGTALAMLGRGTATAVGLGLGWVLVFETVVSTNFKPVRPWLLLGNGAVFIKGQFEGGPAGDVPGRSVTVAGLLLALYLALLVAAAATVFHRSDVS